MFLETLLQDLRIGLRVLIKEKSFCTLAVTVLALGICAVTTMFSVVNGVMLRGFSFPNAERLASVQFIDPSQTNFFGVANQIFALDYREIAEHQKSFEYTTAYINGSTVNVSYKGNPQRYTGAYVTEHFLKILGVRPVLGRDFTPEDNLPGSEKVTLIGHNLWQRDFGATSNIVGTSIRLNGKPATIIGVMPPGFAFPLNEELWIPLFNEFVPKPRNDQSAQGNSPAVIGLLRPEVSIEQASLEISAFAQRLSKEFPDTNKGFNVGLVEPLIRNFTPKPLRGVLLAMLAVCGAVLLLACANVMNMQFARATLRAKELAIRSSLGATRRRLIRQMLTESLLIATIGAALGVMGAYWSTDLLLKAARNLPNPIPSYISFTIDAPVLSFVVGITMLSAIFSGILPAWMASQAHPVDVLKESGRGNTSRSIGVVTRALVVLQILLTSVILIAALLQLQSIIKQQKLDYGYDNVAVMTARMGLMDGDYPTGDARRLFYDRLLRELRASPEVESAALTNRFRMTFSGIGRVEIEGHAYKDDKERPNVNFENITDGYFTTLGLKIREGRDFTSDDIDPKLPVAVVNAGFARKYYPGESAIGRRFRTVGNNGVLFGPWRTIVGVSADIRMLGPINPPNVESVGFYVPYFSAAFGPVAAPVGAQFATIVVKPRGAPARTFANNLRRQVNKVDPNLPLYFVGTARENQESFLGQQRIIATMFSTFGGVAMILAAVGLYGVMSFSVNQRTQEFGIRMALGADSLRILRMVVRQGSRQLAAGLFLGLGVSLMIALVFAEGIKNTLFQISPHDPLTYVVVALALAAVSLVAMLVPARRATRVDPMIALR
ncbi:MAG: ABC transporter permease, partial [Opitutus sp.]